MENVGKGPFPSLVDMFGGLVSIIETRAALLASHGYVTMALSYMHVRGKSGFEDKLDADLIYVKVHILFSFSFKQVNI
jgi:hypothetical protein